ncbi:MAG: asparagine synthase (glutamine-hydrolyzing) [Deltaproteobacteria bacterium]|nr:asparagine synthase (glutamine-hydrolyzing) [Deltaproteobacteria bacterium]
MCGITGIFQRREGRPDPQVLDAMTDALVHRGPDGRGTYLHEGVGLGHRRLSIIGLSDGQQPMTNRTRDIWVTYNGEIYNYMLLKQELESLGYEFRTHSDTEVIVHGYQAWGDHVIDRLRGIFAFVIYDQPRRRLLGVRDRLGVKPLYYHLTPELFLFGSEPKALLKHPRMPKRPDLDTIHLCMRYGYPPAHYSAFAGMHQLEPGCYISVDREHHRVVRYWTPPELGSDDPPNADAELDRQVDETVEIELMSEVPLGAFLSGGIDSSVVAASIARNPKLIERPRTFCIGFPEPKYDESKYSKAVADSLGLAHHVETMSVDSLGLLDKLVEIYDEPFGDSSAIPTYALCKMARQHVTVALSGDGGDEVFGGYRRYKKLHGYRELPSLARRASAIVANRMPTGVRGAGRLERMGLTMPHQYEHEITLFQHRHFEELLTPDLDRQVDWSLADLFARAPGKGPVQKAQWVDLMSYLPGDILTKVDRASMANSLEVRVPLLDHVFVEWAATLPPEKAFGDGQMKVALKDHLARRVPRNLIDRPKMGFGVPLEYWLGGENGLTRIAEGLKAKHPQGKFYSPVRANAVTELARQHGHSDTTAQVWMVLFLETWWQRHFV